MEHNTGNTLGNARKVERIEVDYWNGAQGSASAPMHRRGTAVVFKGNPGNFKGRSVPSEKPMAADNGKYPHGFLAEAVADSDRRKARPGRKTVPLVLPVTFKGIEFVTCTRQTETAVWPGDIIYLTYKTDGDSMLFARSPHSSDRLLSDANYTRYVGIAQVGAPAGVTTLQVKVDSLSISRQFSARPQALARIL